MFFTLLIKTHDIKVGFKNTQQWFGSSSTEIIWSLYWYEWNMSCRSILKRFFANCIMYWCKLVWYSCLKHYAVEYTQRGKHPSSRTRSKQSHLFLGTAACQGWATKELSLLALSTSRHRRDDSSVRYKESCLHPRASHSFLFYLPMAKLCCSQASEL